MLGEINPNVVYLVDSYGSLVPQQLVTLLTKINEIQYPFDLGFHGHNNLELAFANSMIAMDMGCKYIDSTIMGMGRGAGNLRTELWLAYTSRHLGISVDFNALAEIAGATDALHRQFNWGVSLPYIFSGIYSLHQKYVMELVEKRYYSINQIIESLNKRTSAKRNDPFPDFLPEGVDSTEVLIVGGGPSVTENIDAIIKFISLHPKLPIIFSSTRHASLFVQMQNLQYYCLVGREGKRLEDQVGDDLPLNFRAVIPPEPQLVPSYIPKRLLKSTFQSKQITYMPNQNDGQTALAMEIAISLPGIVRAWVIGYDGYGETNLGTRERELQDENDAIFKAVSEHLRLTALTSTIYRNLESRSIYEPEFCEP